MKQPPVHVTLMDSPKNTHTRRKDNSSTFFNCTTPNFLPFVFESRTLFGYIHTRRPQTCMIHKQQKPMK